jgi:hypothetical protein
MRRLALSAALLILAPCLPAAGQSGSVVPPPPDSADGSAFQIDLPGTTVDSAIEKHADDYVGAYEGPQAVYDRESEVYRSAPPLRYNRIEGLVLGLRRAPLDVDSDEDDRTRVFGQAAYATQLRDVRYTVGVESRLYREDDTALKLGVLYQEQTLAVDRWKTSVLENSLAGIGFRHDFFDYYEAEGLSVYGVQSLPRSVRLTAGYRTEAHRLLSNHTDWSVFGSGPFRANPVIDEGRVHALFGSLVAGRVQDLDGLPTGQALRLAATAADGLGGDYSFFRYEADGRVYLPVSDATRLALRLRGGYATSGAPLQAQFTVGGVGSVRSYDQNAFRGTRMLLGNVEYLIDGATVIDGVLDDLYVAGIADAGWVGGPDAPVRLDDVVPSAGFSVGLDERKVRLDVTWPLRNGAGTGSHPAVWLRITPNF